MTTRSIVSPHDQKVTFVELFFDLVFVFSVTQIVGLLHAGLTWTVIGQGVLAFWLVWWAWTQFTWALNAADTTHGGVGVATLMATGVAFFMAVALPRAFAGGAAAFAIPYILVRLIGLALYSRVSAEASAEQHGAVLRFALISMTGLLAVGVGAFLGGTAVYWAWGLAILFDVLAASIAGRSAHWDLHAEHFAERHGLFVIIALGETLIVAAAGLSGEEWTAGLGLIGVLAVAITCSLWWTYFSGAKPSLDSALEGATGRAQAELGRDAFSLLHFPMLCGVIAYAAAIEEAIAHPADPLPLPGRLALGVGLVLFLVGMAGALRRAGVGGTLGRVVVPLVAVAALVLVPAGTPMPTLGIALVGVLAVVGLEHRARV